MFQQEHKNLKINFIVQTSDILRLDFHGSNYTRTFIYAISISSLFLFNKGV